MSRKSKVSRTTFTCGHKGFGGYCHRCEQAEYLESCAKGGTKIVTDKKKHPKFPKRKPKVWTKEEILNEVKRLRIRQR